MKRASILVAGLVIAVVAGIGLSTATAGQPLPPNAKYRGKTVAEWALLHNEWNIATQLGEGSFIPDTVKGMRLLPAGFDGGMFEYEITVSPGTGLVASPFFLFGELCEDGTVDDPELLAGLLDFIFANRTVDVWLDGKLVQSGTLEDLGAFAYGPTYFGSPIFYDPPESRLPAVAAIWTNGVGAVFHPLPPGEHTLVMVTDGPFFGLTSIVYNITVEK